MTKLVNKKIKISILGEEISVRYKTHVSDILKQILDKDTFDKILGVRVNNEVRTIDHELVDDSSIDLVLYDSPDGYRIYTRTVKFLLYMALKRCYPKLEVELCNTIDNNSYFIVNNFEFTLDMAEEILKEMRSIVARNSEITRKMVTYDEAKALYKAENNLEKAEELNMKLASHITFYFCEDTFGTMYGILAPTAGRVPEFSIKKFRGGFVLVYPDPKNMNNVPKVVKDNVIYGVYEETNKHMSMMGIKSIYDLNKKIVDNRIGEIIKASEEIHRQKLADLANIISHKKAKLFLIAGPSSSGKTTFAGKLAIKLRLLGYDPVIISMDNYFKEREDTTLQENGEYDFETIDSLDLELFNEQMEKLISGKEVSLPQFDFYKGTKVYDDKKTKISDNGVIIVEGIHALNPKVSQIVSDEQKFKIYIAPMTTLNIDEFSKVSTTDTRMLRRIVRDYRTRGNNVQATLKLWSNIMKGEAKYINPYVEGADYIFNTSLPYELAILKMYSQPLLFQIESTSEYYSETRRLHSLLSNFLIALENEVPDDSILREFIGEK